MLDQVVPELRIVPSGKDGRFGLVVVVGQERLVLFTLEVGGRVGAARAERSVSTRASYCDQSSHAFDSHDTLRDQPVPHLEVGPRAPDLVLGLPVIVLHQHEHALSVGRRLKDTVVDQPSLEVVVGPSVVDRVVQVLVVDVGHLLEQEVSRVGRLGLDDVLLLEVVSRKSTIGKISHVFYALALMSLRQLSTYLIWLSSQVLQT